MTKELKSCKNCKDFFNGRSNKIFCDTRCKSEYHNRINKDNLRPEMNSCLKKLILGHLKNISKIAQLEIDNINKENRYVRKNNSNHDETMVNLFYYGILSEIRKIKSILLDDNQSKNG